MKSILAILFCAVALIVWGETPPLPPDPIHGERSINSMSLEARRVAREQQKRQAEYLAYERDRFEKLQKLNIEQQKRGEFLRRKAWLASPKNKQ